jgi:hypothetical protein
MSLPAASRLTASLNPNLSNRFRAYPLLINCYKSSPVVNFTDARIVGESRSDLDYKCPRDECQYPKSLHILTW